MTREFSQIMFLLAIFLLLIAVRAVSPIGLHAMPQAELVTDWVTSQMSGTEDRQ